MYEVCDADDTAKATVMVVLPNDKVLFFCEHHYRQHLPKLNDIFKKVVVRDGFMVPEPKWTLDFVAQ